MRIIVVDLDSLTIERSFETAPGAIIHTGNAFQRGNEIIVDGMWQDDFAANDTLTDVFNPHKRFGGGWYDRYDFEGEIDELRISRVARSPHWARLTYENQKPLQTLVGPLAPAAA